MKKIVLASSLTIIFGAIIYFMLVANNWKNKAGETAPIDGALSDGPAKNTLETAHEGTDSRGDSPPNSHENSIPPSSASNFAALHFEQQLLSNKSMNSKKIETLLFSKKFENEIDRFRNESANNADALDLTELYRKILIDHLMKNKISANLSTLTCGTTLCIGSLKNGTESEYKKWADILFKDTSVPMFGFINTTLQFGEGTWEHRFVFSADPLSGSISTPMR